MAHILEYKKYARIVKPRLIECISEPVSLFVFILHTAIRLNSFISWDITTCSPLKLSRLLGVTPVRYHLHAAFLLGLFFDPED
jgi:hypothetical protein